MSELQQIIEQAWETRTELQPGTAPARVGEAVAHILEELNQGTLRVDEKIDGAWAYVTNVAGERVRKNVAYIPFLTEKGEQVIYCTTSRKIASLIDILGYDEVGSLEETEEVTKTAKGVIMGNIAIEYVDMKYGDKKYPVPTLVEKV